MTVRLTCPSVRTSSTSLHTLIMDYGSIASSFLSLSLLSSKYKKKEASNLLSLANKSPPFSHTTVPRKPLTVKRAHIHSLALTLTIKKQHTPYKSDSALHSLSSRLLASLTFLSLYLLAFPPPFNPKLYRQRNAPPLSYLIPLLFVLSLSYSVPLPQPVPN